MHIGDTNAGMKPEFDRDRFKRQYSEEDWNFLMSISTFEQAWRLHDPSIQDIATELLHGTAETMTEFRRLREVQKKRYNSN